MGRSDRAFLYLYQHQDILSMTEDVPKTDAGKAREGLIDELKTINHYEEMADESKDPVLKRQFEEITDDERVHVGNFAEMIADKDKKAEPLMREGFEEARKLRKSMFYSFKDMMGGASHFKKTGPLRELDYTADQYQKIMGIRGRKSYQGPPKVRNAAGGRTMTRKAQIPAKWRLWSRLNQMQDLAYGAADLLTVDMLGQEFNSMWALQGYPSHFEYDGQTYTMRSAKTKTGPYAGTKQYYVFAYDPDMKDFVQLIRKYNRKGGYLDAFLTDKTTQHRPVRGDAQKEVVTYDTVLKEYNQAVDDERVPKPNRRREEYYGEVLGPKFTLEDYFDTDGKGIDDRIDEYFQENPPKDMIWEDPSEEKLAILRSVDPATLKKLRKMNTPKEFEEQYPAIQKDMDTLLNSAGIGSVLSLRDPEKMKVFKDSLTYNTPKVPKEKMRAQDYQNALIDHISRADTDFHGVNALSKLMLKPEQFFKKHPKSKSMVSELAKELLDDETIEEINAMNISNDAKRNLLSKTVAKEVYFSPELFTEGTASGDYIRSIVKDYVDSDPSLGAEISQNMADFLQNSSPTRKEMQMFMNSSGINEGLKEHYARMMKEQEDRKRISLFPNGVSPDVLDGVFRNWGKVRIPREEGDALLSSKLTDETIVPYHLMDKVMEQTRRNAEEAEQIANARVERDTASGEVAQGERNKILANHPNNEKWKEVNEDIRDFQDAVVHATSQLRSQEENDANTIDQDGQLPTIPTWTGSAKDYIKYLEDKGIDYDYETIARGLRGPSARGSYLKELIGDVFLKKGVTEALPKKNPNDPTERPRYHVNLEKLKEFVTDLNENATDEQVNLINGAIRALKLKGEQTATFLAENLKDRVVQKELAEQVNKPSEVRTHNPGADVALFEAKNSRKKVENEEIKDALRLGMPSDFTGDELKDTPKERKRLSPFGGQKTPWGNARQYTKEELKDMEETDNENTEPFAQSASFAEMLKSATAKKWEEKGLPSGSMEATLPAYYRTVTMGSDRDAINVYEHQKMPVGGKGISMKKVPGIGPKMSTKGDE